jgi:hypoxanthine phosphoribosyltransferase
MAITPEQAAEVWARAELLYPEKAVEGALDDMARRIRQRLSGSDPLVLPIMVGGVVLAGKLLPRLEFPLRLDYIHATRYRGETRGGELDWIHRPYRSLAAQTVLLLDDILDEGITLSEIATACRRSGAREVLSAVLVEKLHDRGNGFKADFVGLRVEDRYVFGYGMDYKDYLRNAAGIYAIREET